MVYVKLVNNKNKDKYVQIKPTQVSSVHDSEYDDGVCVVNMINGNQYEVVGESDNIVEMIQESMDAKYISNKNITNNPSKSSLSVSDQIKLLEMTVPYNLYNSIKDDKYIKIMRRPISPFDTPPVLQDYNNMLEDIMGMVGKKPKVCNIIKPLIFGEEAIEMF